VAGLKQYEKGAYAKIWNAQEVKGNTKDLPEYPIIKDPW